jgi:hypothetical protein
MTYPFILRQLGGSTSANRDGPRAIGQQIQLMQK